MIYFGVAYDDPPMTRREFTQGLASGAALLATKLQAGESNAWTKDWDRAVLQNAVKSADSSFDPAESLLVHDIGPEYHYHTNLRGTRAHITRDSLDYAMNLLETGEPERKKRGETVLDRMLSLQDTNPDSKWYGLWGYYMEEPASKMSPADWNWADFNGATLLFINARHGRELPLSMRRRLIEAIRHSAISVMRRNVSMSYTNIAVQGTFVTLAAAQLLHEESLQRYASDRLRRFCATVDETGSFAEYNSPTYANVTVLNLVRMKMLLHDDSVLKLVDRLHERIWLHLADHWHAPTRQLAGPMSRCYSTDIGKPLWLQKSLGGALPFATLDEIRDGTIHQSGEVSYLEYHCPENLRSKFLSLPDAHEHRELFLFTGNPAEPVEGATYLAPSYSIGSANRSEFWIQRRPLLAYWDGSTRPARYVQMRFLKDDYDFSSALFWSVQSKNHVACIVNFRSPGGDKHISLDPIQNGEFEASRLRIRFDLSQVSAAMKILVDGKPAKFDERYPASARVAVDLGSAFLGVQFRSARFGNDSPALILAKEEGMTTISLDLFHSSTARKVNWKDVGPAFAAGVTSIAAAEGELAAFDNQLAGLSCECVEQNGRAELRWHTPAGDLSVAGGAGISTVQEQNKLAAFSIDGQPVSLVRLSDKTIL